ncbi:phytanoyl-CoA dioxygenase family protein [Micromonospora sp. WMMD980]|uniref:phytanoyl-CoA dioxygenase family protein n=1 Tax=Micromonospora sp. WMMD980 TaxID=3016088 RepID=UPI002416A51F|nr:phytanoyl-CoA dioxygenase family protein [Micromonospora sp. WMMD980]MDG4803727.1 phytanoyl-CoA dioxygenase family protein [Micromonospora sp. WMMD980]
MMRATGDDLRRRFRQDGYLAIEGFLERETLSQLRVAADLAFEQIIGQTMSLRTAHPRLTWWRLPDGRPYVFKIKPVVDLAPAFVGMAASEDIGFLASSMLSAKATLMEDKVTYKAALADPADWADLPVLGEDVRKHSDASYFAARGYDRVITVALCLDDCPAAAGALQVWPGSHRRPVRHEPTPAQGPVVPDDDAPDDQAVTLEASAGSLLAWDAALVHASGPNSTDRPRRLLVLGYSASGS